MDFFAPNIANFVWGLAAFVVFVLILFKAGVSRILVAVDARDKKISGELAEAELTFKRSKALQAELEQKMRDAEGRISALMAEAKRESELHKSQMVEQGRSEIDTIRQRSLGEIEAARHAAIVHLRTEVAEIAVLVADKIVRGRMDESKHEELVQKAIEAFEATGAGKKG